MTQTSSGKFPGSVKNIEFCDSFGLCRGCTAFCEFLPEVFRPCHRVTRSKLTAVKNRSLRTSRFFLDREWILSKGTKLFAFFLE